MGHRLTSSALPLLMAAGVSAALASPAGGAAVAVGAGSALPEAQAPLPAAEAAAPGAVGLPAAAAPSTAAEAGQGDNVAEAIAQKDPVNAYRDLLLATNELWFLLSGIRDKADADKAAKRFVELVSQVNKMDDDLLLMGEAPQQQESLDQLRYQIMDAYCSVDSEFGGLCRVRCYGSQELVDAFQSAVAGGMFDADDLPLLEIHRPFSKEEARAELARIKKLAKPDKALLDALRGVTDSGTASACAPELARQVEKLRGLLPDSKLAKRNFADVNAPSVRAACEPVESTLWGIRSEIVRIAGLPGYSDEPFDTFSDTLDEVYAVLAETHTEWFNDVFDESFRMDLDEAYRENTTQATTSN